MAFKTIMLNSDVLKLEGIASGAITPGHLLERTSVVDTVKVHATAGGVAQKLFAIEDENQGKEIGDAYVSGQRCFFINAIPGNVLWCILANGQTIAAGDKLVSAGDGTLQKATVDSSAVIVEQTVIAVALDALDLSGSSGADALLGNRIRVEIV